MLDRSADMVNMSMGDEYPLGGHALIEQHAGIEHDAVFFFGLDVNAGVEAPHGLHTGHAQASASGDGKIFWHM